MAAQDQEQVQQVQPAYKETHMTVSDMSSQDQTPGSGLQGLVLDRLEKVDRSPEEWRETSEALVPLTGMQQKSFISQCSKCAAKKTDK